MDKRKLQTKKDIKFLTDIGIMAMLNIMLIAWQPVVEIPITLILIVASLVQKESIQKFELQLEN